MIKTLIVEDNLEYAKKILNTIINNFEEVRVTHIATTVKEAMDIMANNNINLIFLDLKLPDTSGIEVIKQVKFLNNIEDPYIIIISGDNYLSSMVAKEYNVCDVLSKLESNNVLHSRIEKVVGKIIILKNKKNIKERINEELSKMGYNWKYKGTYYILESILYIYEKNNIDLLDNLEQNVYKYVSFKSNKSINNIKTNIIKSTNKLEDTNYFIEKPTPKLVISMILNKLMFN